MHRRWFVNRTNQDFLDYLSRKISISTAFSQILVNRGIKDARSIGSFLSPSLEAQHDPFLMPDMVKAVERIKQASSKGEIVLVYGDYDADGLTSTAIMVSALKMLGLKPYYYIPNRITEGYGLSREGLLKAKSLSVNLIITVDCGISSHGEVQMAADYGMDVIITDHHEPPEKLPDAFAILNPRRQDSEYPFKDLAGVGVAYKLVQGLYKSYKSYMTYTSSLLDLVAIGTIGDSVPLVGENRIFVTYGLKAINDSPKPWAEAIKETAGIKGKEIKSTSVSFTIVPRINAVGRLGSATDVVKFFLAEDKENAAKMASFLEGQNRTRQKYEEEVAQQAFDMVKSQEMDRAIVLAVPGWHIGVLGIVASRLADAFYRPAFVLSINDSIAKGSARSIPPFHIFNGLSECAELFLGFGGHSQAAGLKLRTENLDAFKKRINSVIEAALTEGDMIPRLEIDAGVELFEINFNLVNELSRLEPFGDSNQEPVLGARNLEILEPRIVGENHLKMRLRQKAISFDTIGFDMGNLLEVINTANTVDAAFTPCINEWNGGRYLQLNLKALRPGMSS
ncbi:MAG: single-stranded-DNA-specific exonuclease RecJ [Nitrospirae bacterium]|nr:single-stranded-DNA-specific exonuclease RecJ [Nitrospirota bacterium]